MVNEPYLTKPNTSYNVSKCCRRNIMHKNCKQTTGLKIHNGVSLRAYLIHNTSPWKCELLYKKQQNSSLYTWYVYLFLQPMKCIHRATVHTPHRQNLVMFLPQLPSMQRSRESWTFVSNQKKKKFVATFITVTCMKYEPCQINNKLYS